MSGCWVNVDSVFDKALMLCYDQYKSINYCFINWFYGHVKH